jgi:hypothetical protein
LAQATSAKLFGQLPFAWNEPVGWWLDAERLRGGQAFGHAPPKKLGADPMSFGGFAHACVAERPCDDLTRWKLPAFAWHGTVATKASLQGQARLIDWLRW